MFAKELEIDLDLTECYQSTIPIDAQYGISANFIPSKLFQNLLKCLLKIYDFSSPNKSQKVHCLAKIYSCALFQPI